MSPILTFVLVAVSLLTAGTVIFRQQRRQPANQTPQEPRAIDGVRETDLVHALNAIARLQRAHESTRSTVDLIQGENANLKDELTWLLTELAVRPEPHKAVRLLYQTGPMTLNALNDAIGANMAGVIDDLVASFQVKPVVDSPDSDVVNYEFIPHCHRPTTSPDLAPLNRCLSLLVDATSVGEDP